jgi:hypothetical protein
MNKLTTSTKFGLLLALVVLSSSLLYLLFFRSTSSTSPGSSKDSKQRGSEVIAVSESQEVVLGQSKQEVAPVYSDIESSDATIQISEETRKNSPTSLPQGFGLGQTDPNSPESNQSQGAQSPDGQQLQELPVDLETPVESNDQQNTKPTSPESSSGNSNATNPEKDPSQSGIDTMDPREVGVTANDGPDKDYEETVLTVQRTLTAVNPDGEKQLIRLKIPVMYKSRTLRLEGPTKAKAQELLEKLKTKGSELTKIKTELEAALVEWNQLVNNATPNEVLLPESPTLPQNQSAGRLNREDNPSMSAGKAISYEIINKQ